MSEEHRDLTEPILSRPIMPPEAGVSTSPDGLLPWMWAMERLAAAALYWMGTTWPDGRPHAKPVWGVWLDDALYLETSPVSRTGRNLATNPALVVHVERGEEIVIVEGRAQEIIAPDRSLEERLADAFAAKYSGYRYRPDPGQWERGGLYLVHLRVAFAWKDIVRDATRYRF